MTEHDTEDIAPRYVDRDGNPIDLMEWGKRFEDHGYKIVAEETVTVTAGSSIQVRTVWVGIICPCLDEQPFTTGVRVEGGRFTTVAQYDTLEEALVGHRDVVIRMRKPNG